MSAIGNVVNPGQGTAWHAIPANEAVGLLDSNTRSGLAAGEVSRRLAEFGRNRLPEGSKKGHWKRFLLQFKNILIYVLLAAGFVKLMVGLWLDAAIILGVVIINSFLGFIQEGKAEKALDAIRNMLSGEARTVRDGQTRIVLAEDVVPGDIVLLESGDKVPADLRLIDVKTYGPRRRP